VEDTEKIWPSENTQNWLRCWKSIGSWLYRQGQSPGVLCRNINEVMCSCALEKASLKFGLTIGCSLMTVLQLTECSMLIILWQNNVLVPFCNIGSIAFGSFQNWSQPCKDRYHRLQDIEEILKYGVATFKVIPKEKFHKYFQQC